MSGAVACSGCLGGLGCGCCGSAGRLGRPSGIVAFAAAGCLTCAVGVFLPATTSAAEAWPASRACSGEPKLISRPGI